MTNGKKHKKIRLKETLVISKARARYNDELAERYLPLVLKLAQGISARIPLNSRIDFDELCSEGGLGLSQAIVRFRKGKSNHPEGYFRLRIWGSMIRLLQNGDVLSRLDRDRWNRIQSKQIVLEQKLRRCATPEEIGARCHLSQDELSLINGGRITHGSFESINDESRFDDHSRWLADTDQEHPSDLMIRKENLRALRQAVNRLPDFLRTVIVHIFYEDVEAKEIATRRGVSEAYISRSRQKAIELLRGAMERFARE